MRNPGDSPRPAGPPSPHEPGDCAAALGAQSARGQASNPASAGSSAIAGAGRSAGAGVAEPRRELTVRAVVVAMFVAVIVGASYPYIVLKIGYGPNISVVSAFFGYLVLSALGFFTGIRGTRWENNLVQTAGTAAGEAGFMCVVLAAMDMLRTKFGAAFPLQMTSLQIFVWISVAGLLGVLLAVPLRRHYIDEEDLPFADGTAAGETMLVLDLDRNAGRARLKWLGAGLISSALMPLLTQLHFKLLRGATVLPEQVSFGNFGERMRMGSEVSLLSFGSGLLVGMRVTLSMGLGMLLAWVVAPPLLTQGPDPILVGKTVGTVVFSEVLKWVMWPATGLMLAGGLTALVLKWKVIAKSFRGLSTAADEPGAGEEFPLRWVAAGSVFLSVLLAVVQKVSLDFPLWLTLISLLLSVILMLVGIRVLGETNWAPISAMANVMQAVFAALSPGSMVHNMVGSGMSGTVAANGEHLMQDYKAGKIVGANNRHLTYVQLLAVPVGAGAVALVYPALTKQYRIGVELTSPVSIKWAGFAELLNEGLGKLPRGCFAALGIALALGIVFTLLEPRHRKWVPSPTGFGLGMLIPGYAVLPMVVGGLVQFVWQRVSPKHEEAYNTPLASGFIAGEALVVVLFAILAVSGVKL